MIPAHPKPATNQRSQCRTVSQFRPVRSRRQMISASRWWSEGTNEWTESVGDGASKALGCAATLACGYRLAPTTAVRRRVLAPT
eukprot:scaffold64773_cov25-Tisochrysis_lutea.AAC.2